MTTQNKTNPDGANEAKSLTALYENSRCGMVNPCKAYWIMRWKITVESCSLTNVMLPMQLFSNSRGIGRISQQELAAWEVTLMDGLENEGVKGNDHG